MSTTGPKPTVISEPEYNEGAVERLHPRSLAKNETYAVRLLTPEMEHFAVEIARTVLRVEALDEGYLVTIILPDSHQPEDSVDWRFGADGYRRGSYRPSIRRADGPDGYIVAVQHNWDDDLVALLSDDLVISNEYELGSV